MHKEPYENIISTYSTESVEEYRKCLTFVRNHQCNTVILTGHGSPQQNMEFIRNFSKINKSLESPFTNVEIQTTGAALLIEKLPIYGVNLVSLSVSSLIDDELNSHIINNNHTPIQLLPMCEKIKALGMQLRLSLNMTELLFKDKNPSVEAILNVCKTYHADQVIFRKMYTSEDNTPQTEFIKEHNIDESWFETLKKYIVSKGIFMGSLKDGRAQYLVNGISCVIDTDCMAKESKGTSNLKYLILREDCHLYSQWDDKKSIIL